MITSLPIRKPTQTSKSTNGHNGEGVGASSALIRATQTIPQSIPIFPGKGKFAPHGFNARRAPLQIHELPHDTSHRAPSNLQVLDENECLVMPLFDDVILQLHRFSKVEPGANRDWPQQQKPHDKSRSSEHVPPHAPHQHELQSAPCQTTN